MTRALAQLEKRVQANGIAPVGQALCRLELPTVWWFGTRRPLDCRTTARQRGRDASVRRSMAGRGRWIGAVGPSYVEPAEHELIINARHPRLAEVALVMEPEITVALDRERGVGRMPWGTELPRRPFFGVMGVAPPPAWGAISSISRARTASTSTTRN